MKLLRFFLILFICFLSGLDIYCFYYGYPVLLNYFTPSGRYDQQGISIYNLLTPAKFHRLELLLLFYTLCFGVVLIKYNKIYHYLKTPVHQLYTSFCRSFITAWNSEVKYLMIIPVSVIIYLVVSRPVNIDEAVTYINFTNKGVLASICYYPIPNNHIFSSLISNFTRYLPIPDPLYRLRLPAAISFILTLIIAHAFMKEYLGRNSALIITATASVLLTTLLYGFLARGYGLQLLFFTIAAFSLFNIVQKNNQAKDWIALTLSSVLSFYTLPSFLYAFIMLNILLLFFNYKNIQKQIICCTVVVAGTVILYMPVFIVSGINSVTNNHFVKRILRKEAIYKLPGFLRDLVFDTTGIQYMYIALFLILAVSFIYLVIRKKRAEVLIYSVFLLVPPALLIVQSVIPFSRTFNYYTFVLVFLVVLPYSGITERFKTVYLLPSLFIIQIILVCTFFYRLGIFGNMDIQAHQLSLKIEGNKKYLAADDMFGDYLQYELTTKGYGDASVTNYYTLKTISADSIKGYDYIIIRKELDQTRLKVPEIVMDYYNVY